MLMVAYWRSERLGGSIIISHHYLSVVQGQVNLSNPCLKITCAVLGALSGLAVQTQESHYKEHPQTEKTTSKEGYAGAADGSSAGRLCVQYRTEQPSQRFSNSGGAASGSQTYVRMYFIMWLLRISSICSSSRLPTRFDSCDTIQPGYTSPFAPTSCESQSCRHPLGTAPVPLR